MRSRTAGYRPRRAIPPDTYRVRTDDPTAQDWRDRQVRITAIGQGGQTRIIQTTELDTSKVQKALLVTPEFVDSPAMTTLRLSAAAMGLRIVVGSLGG